MEQSENRIRESSNRQPESQIKQQIFEKVRKRMAELENQAGKSTSFCPELNPDVIVISDDQSFLFEPQNQRALELLAFRCGLMSEGGKLRERIRVHPLRRRKIIDELKAAGVTVSGDFQDEIKMGWGRE